MQEISNLLLKFCQKSQKAVGLELTWSEKTTNYLAKKGITLVSSPAGKRLIQQDIETP